MVFEAVVRAHGRQVNVVHLVVAHKHHELVGVPKRFVHHWDGLVVVLHLVAAVCHDKLGLLVHFVLLLVHDVHDVVLRNHSAAGGAK